MTDVIPRHIFYGIIIFTLVLVGGISMISHFNTAESGFANDDKFNRFNESFNKLDSINQTLGGLEEDVTKMTTDAGQFGWLSTLVGGGWKALQTLVTSFGFMHSILYGTSIFGVPFWIPGLITLLIVVLVIFSILSAIFQHKT